jgi:hypothetical protein
MSKKEIIATVREISGGVGALVLISESPSNVQKKVEVIG